MRAAGEHRRDGIGSGGIRAEEDRSIVKSHAGNGSVGGDCVGREGDGARLRDIRAVVRCGHTDLWRHVTVGQAKLRDVGCGGVFLGAIVNDAVGSLRSGIDLERHEAAGWHGAGDVCPGGGGKGGRPAIKQGACGRFVVPSEGGLAPGVVIYFSHGVHTRSSRGGAGKI